MDEIRWGILGSGYVAGNFANGLRHAGGCRLQAVASRRIEAAAALAAEQGPAVTVHESFESLVADPSVDVVYVATPNECHLEHSLLAIAAGKPTEAPLRLRARGRPSNTSASPSSPTIRAIRPARAAARSQLKGLGSMLRTLTRSSCDP